MPPRKLRILQSDGPDVVGVCESCNRQFKSALLNLMEAGRDIKAQFEEHTCRPHNPAKSRSSGVSR